MLMKNAANESENLYLARSSRGASVDQMIINPPMGYNDQLMERLTAKFIIRQSSKVNNIKEVRKINDRL